jgi:hypothetical protein
VAALSEALLAAGIDPEPITARVEASYLGVDAAGGAAAGSDGEDGLYTVSPGVGDQQASSPAGDEQQQQQLDDQMDSTQESPSRKGGLEMRGSSGGFVYSAPAAIPFASHVNGLEAAEQWALGQEEDVLC